MFADYTKPLQGSLFKHSCDLIMKEKMNDTYVPIKTSNVSKDHRIVLGSNINVGDDASMYGYYACIQTVASHQPVKYWTFAE